jgi:hypothetical protein
LISGCSPPVQRRWNFGFILVSASVRSAMGLEHMFGTDVYPSAGIANRI